MTADPAGEPGWLADVRASYDAVAADYAELLRDELAARPVDVAVLADFAERVAAAGGGPVVDLGCGPGRITAHLASLGTAIRGVDLSPGMIAVARRAHPGLRFDVGSMTALDWPDAALAGVVAWYSLIHVPTAELPAVLAGLVRSLRPGGLLLLAFQVGTEPVHLEHAYGHDVALVVHRRPVDLVERLLAEAGLVLRIRTVRDPEQGERSPQAYLLAGRPDD